MASSHSEYYIKLKLDFYILFPNIERPETRALHSELLADADTATESPGDYPLLPNNTGPSFTTSDMPKIEVKPAGNTLRLKCPANGNPVPNITWYKNNEELNRTQGLLFNKWTLRKDDTVIGDKGNYTCKICNPIGCIEHTINVDIIGEFNDIYFILIRLFYMKTMNFYARCLLLLNFIKSSLFRQLFELIPTKTESYKAYKLIYVYIGL